MEDSQSFRMVNGKLCAAKNGQSLMKAPKMFAVNLDTNKVRGTMLLMVLDQLLKEISTVKEVRRRSLIAWTKLLVKPAVTVRIKEWYVGILTRRCPNQNTHTMNFQFHTCKLSDAAKLKKKSDWKCHICVYNRKNWVKSATKRTAKLHVIILRNAVDMS